MTGGKDEESFANGIEKLAWNCGARNRKMMECVKVYHRRKFDVLGKTTWSVLAHVLSFVVCEAFGAVTVSCMCGARGFIPCDDFVRWCTRRHGHKSRALSVNKNDYRLWLDRRRRQPPGPEKSLSQ